MKLKFTVLFLILLSPATKASVDDFDFDFSATGDRAVRPVQVFTDGEKTYFQFRNPQNPPTMIAKGRVVRYTIEEPYAVVIGLDSSTTLIGEGGRDKSEVKYNGRFTPTKFLAPAQNTLPTSQAIKPINQPAVSVPQTEVEKPANTQVVATTPRIEPKAESPSVVTMVPTPRAETPGAAPQTQAKAPTQVKQEFIGEFVFFPAKVSNVALAQVPSAQNNAQALALGESIVTSPQIVSMDPVVPKSFFVEDNHPLNNAQIEMIITHVASGGIVSLQGSSGDISQTSRVRLANSQANKTKDELIARGISATAIKVHLINKYPNTKDVTGVSITLTKGSLT
jgi:hypothetical protein